MAKQGTLSIHSENIFPIIKKWMYSDQDIFVRELVSNASDAVTKLQKLSLIGEWEKPEDYQGRIDVIVDTEKKTLCFTDNGLGMTEEEVEKYITQIAFSGATDFIEKYKDKANEEQIIGHFGLGFYSAFMVASLVEIDTLSCQKDAKPVHWECGGGTEYRMTEGSRTTVGTSITLHLNEDCLKYANEWEMRTILEKYCSFMPVEIYLQKLPKEEETIESTDRLPTDTVLEEIPEKTETDKDGKEIKTPAKLRIERRPVLMNETHPLWTKSPSECKKEEYLGFYQKVFHDYKEPLFWIHLNMDYPYNLKGILYFPKINMEYESIEGKIKLYNNQVFIADNIKEVIPEYLLLLKGVIDCPDLPLNVSRSQLQNDGFVKKISDYITKKVADKLSGMCKTDRENYEKYWDDIAPFIKYGCLRDAKFCERMTDYILFKDLDGKYMALPECLETGKKDLTTEEKNTANKENSSVQDEAADASKQEEQETVTGTEERKPEEDESASMQETDGSEAGSEAARESKEKTIYYATDLIQQSQYVRMFKDAGRTALVLPERIDQPFIQELEAKNPGVHFKRIDSDLEGSLCEDLSPEEQEEAKEQGEKLEKSFRTVTGREKLHVKLQKLSSEKLAAILSLSEESRRMNDMMKMYAMQGMSMGELPVEETLLLNSEHPLVKFLREHPERENTRLVTEQLYDLARIQQAPLPEEEMAKFVERSQELLLRLAKN